MRTTVSISDELLEAAKRQASARGTTVGQVIEAALRRHLAADEQHVDPPTVPIFTGGTGPRAGLDLSSNRDIYAVLDDVDLDKMA